MLLKPKPNIAFHVMYDKAMDQFFVTQDLRSNSGFFVIHMGSTDDEVRAHNIRDRLETNKKDILEYMNIVNIPTMKDKNKELRKKKALSNSKNAGIPVNNYKNAAGPAPGAVKMFEHPGGIENMMEKMNEAVAESGFGVIISGDIGPLANLSEEELLEGLDFDLEDEDL